MINRGSEVPRSIWRKLGVEYLRTVMLGVLPLSLVAGVFAYKNSGFGENYCDPNLVLAVKLDKDTNNYVQAYYNVGFKKMEVRTPSEAYRPLAESYAVLAGDFLNDNKVDIRVAVTDKVGFNGDVDPVECRVTIVFDPTGGVGGGPRPLHR